MFSKNIAIRPNDHIKQVGAADLREGSEGTSKTPSGRGIKISIPNVKIILEMVASIALLWISAAQGALLVTPNRLAFGNQWLNTSSAAMTVKITNNNATTIRGSIRIIGTNAADFRDIRGGTCSVGVNSLPAFKSCTLKLIFKPTMAGVKRAEVKFNGISAVSLSGNGVSLPNFTPTKLDFGSQWANTSSAAMAVTITNNNATTISGSISIAGINAADFSDAGGGTCIVGAISLPAMGSCTLRLKFTSNGVGAESGVVMLNGINAVTLNGTSSGPLVDVAPILAGQIALNPVVINVSKTDNHDPRVDQDVATYTSRTGTANEVRYYKFSTTTDSNIPGGIGWDESPEVQSGRIIFSRNGVLSLFDTTSNLLTGIPPQAPLPSSYEAIGSNTVAWIDQKFLRGQYLYSWDAVTQQWQLVDNTLFGNASYEQFISVSPTGDMIAWSSCTNLNSCEVKMAQRTAGGTWAVTPIAPTPNNYSGPDISSASMVWSDHYQLNNSMFFKAVNSPNIYHLSMLPGTGFASARIFEDTILFKLSMGAIYDLALYHIPTNRLFQLTGTADSWEHDITRLSTGEYRIVFQTNGVFGKDIYGATFNIPAGYCRLMLSHVPPTCLPVSSESLATSQGTVNINLVSPQGAVFAARPSVSNLGNSSGFSFPVGVISFTAQLPVGNQDLVVTLNFEPQLPAGLTQLFKVAVDSNTGSSTLVPIDSSRWTRTDTATSSTITLTLTDGLYPLDSDGAVNGVIVDPLAIGVSLH